MLILRHDFVIASHEMLSLLLLKMVNDLNNIYVFLKEDEAKMKNENGWDCRWHVQATQSTSSLG